MYTVDEHDKVIELTDIPQSSVGAPIPVVLSDEHTLLLAYYLQDTPEGWNGETVRMVGLSSKDEPCALVQFESYWAYMFGPPNDEAFHGHPLSKRGLAPYAVFKVENSSWIRQLERMNGVHPYHKPEHFTKYVHYVFAFHDSTFECIAESFTMSLFKGSMAQAMEEMQRRLLKESGIV